MPKLEITPVGMRDQPALMCAIAAAWMLWPDNEVKRKWALKALGEFITEAFMAEFGAELRKRGIRLTRVPAIDMAPHLARLTEEVYRPWSLHMQHCAGVRVSQGCIAGHLLHEVVGRSHVTPEKASLGLLRTEVENALSKDIREVRDKRLFRGVSKKSMENLLSRRMSSVAHFWAERVCRGYNAADIGILISEFPCAPKDLPSFLVGAEFYRREGEALELKYRKGQPVLDPAKTLRLPPEVLGHDANFVFVRAPNVTAQSYK